MRRRVKSIIAVLLAGTLMLGPVGAGVAATSGTTAPPQIQDQINGSDSSAPTVNLDGQKLSFDVSPRIENGRTLVPLRAIFEALGATIEWDDTSKTVTAVKGSTNIKLTIDQAMAYKNGNEVKLDVAAKIVNSRTLVPLRFVSEAIGATVNWDETTRLITITGDTTSSTSITDLQSTLNTYLEDVGSDYFDDSGIDASCSLSGSKSSLVYTVTFDFSDAYDYDILTDLSQATIKSFVNVFKYQVSSAISGTDYKNASISGTIKDQNNSGYYVTISGSSCTFSWDESETDLSDIADDLEDTFSDAGDDYFSDESIAVTVGLSGDEDDLAYTVKLDFDDADSYDNLTDLSESDIDSFLDDVVSELTDAIDGTDYEEADVIGKLIDNDTSSYYVKDNGSTYTYSWDFSLSDVRDTLYDDFEDAGDTYFEDDGIATTISLSGDEDDLVCTIRLDFDDASDYDELSDLSESDMESFLEEVMDQISDEIEDTDYEDADITGKLVDNNDSSLYAEYDGSDFTYSWD